MGDYHEGHEEHEVKEEDFDSFNSSFVLFVSFVVIFLKRLFHGLQSFAGLGLDYASQARGCRGGSADCCDRFD